MSLVQRLQQLIKDPVRLAQLFMLCRQTGVILSSIVIARILPLEDVGVIEMLMLSGYLMTFFWSDALLKGFLAIPNQEENSRKSSGFFWLYVISALIAMMLLVLGQRILLPVLVGRSSLNGLALFALYQAMIVPVWAAPFIKVLKGLNPVLLSVYVLIGPSFACWAGLMSLPGLSGVLIGLLSYALVGFIWVLINMPFVRELRLKEMMISLWPVTWPLVMYALSTGLARSFDTWLIARNFDESSFAIFRYGAREFPLAIAFAAGLSTIMIPKLKTADALDELKTRSTRLMHICYPIVAVVMLFSPVLFEFFFGVAYKGSALIFNIYLLLTLTQFVFPQSIMTARGDTRILWYISMAELAVNIISSLILLKYFGLIGIVWGTLIAYVFEKAVLMTVTRRRYGIEPHRLIHFTIWGAYGVLLFLVFISARWMFGI